MRAMTPDRLPRWIAETLRQGFSALGAGRPEAASECCRRLLAAKPDLVEAHFLVGLIALNMKETWTAVSAFGSVTKIQPEHGAAWAHLAKLLVTAGHATRADFALERAVQHEDGNPIVHDLLGIVYSLLGDQQEALKWYTKATERKTRDREHVRELEKLIANGDNSPQALAFLNYALGKEFEDLEDWDEAFAAFHRGASARRSIIDFDEAAETEMYEALGKICTAEWLDRQGAAATIPHRYSSSASRAPARHWSSGSSPAIPVCIRRANCASLV